MRYAATAALAVLATAAPAQAARAQVPPVQPLKSKFLLHAGPLNVHGYTMTFDASRTIGVHVTFVRTAPGTRQTHIYNFGHVHLTGRRNLRAGRLTARLGRFGSIDLRFRRTGAIHKRAPGPGCTGPAIRHRAGRLTGTFRLVADTTYFGTVTASRLPADLTRLGPGVCTSTGTPSQLPGPLTLTAGGDSGTTLTVTRLSGGRSSQDVTVNTSQPAAFHEIASTGPAGSFTGSTGAATVTAAPGFSGTLSYTATKRLSPFSTNGTFSGDYTALFDSLGPTTVPGPSALVTGPR